MKKILITTLLLSLFISNASMAWDGYDYEKGTYIEIGKGNLVRVGEDIEFYEYDSGEYQYGRVESINRHGYSVEIEVYDYSAGKYRTFEMDR